MPAQLTPLCPRRAPCLHVDRRAPTNRSAASRSAASRVAVALRVLLLFLVPAFVPAFVAVAPAHAAVITVDTTTDELNSDGDCSLREAIQAANTDSPVDACSAGTGLDTVRIPTGLYELTIPGAGEDSGLMGDLDILAGTTVESISKTPPTIRSNVADRAFDVRLTTTAEVVFRNLRIIESGTTTLNGGGIHQSSSPGGTVLIESCELLGNEGSFGGAVHNQGGSMTIRASTLRTNESLLSGGAVSTGGATSFLVVEDSLIQDNYDQAMLYPLVGAGTGGGGLYIDGPAWIRRSTIDGNETGGSGGGIVVSINDTAMIDNVTISRNHAFDMGGGIHCGTSTAGNCAAEVRSSTITRNSASTGAGIQGDIAIPYLSLQNSIVAENVTPTGGLDIEGYFWTRRHNLIGKGDTGKMVPFVLGAPNTDHVGTATNPLDPELDGIGYNGNALPSYRPLPASLAVDSGDSDGLSVDMHGTPRPSLPEIGAVELPDYNVRFYLDLGTGATLVGPSYAAAAILPSPWQESALGTTDLVDPYGQPTEVDVQVSAEESHTPGLIIGPDPAQHLLADDVYDCTGPAQWSVDFSSLPPGEYVVYVYAPADANTGTGILEVGGQTLSALPGDASALIEFQTYVADPVSVNDGTLNISGEQVFGTACAGVAGVQVLPEPGTGVMLVVGALALIGAERRRARGR